MTTQIHHLIPNAVYEQTTTLTDLARRGLYRQNSPNNFIELDISIHNGYDQAHRAYNDFVKGIIDEIDNNLLQNRQDFVSPNASQEEADQQIAQIRAKAIYELQNQLN